MTENSKKLYRKVEQLNRALHTAPKIFKALIFLIIGLIAGEQFFEGRTALASVLLGFGLMLSLSGMCECKSRK